jgi:hypothetical protein
VEPKREAFILKVSGNTVDGVIDEVASELPIRLILNNEPLVTLLCTPSELKEVAVGFLLSEGILQEKSSIKKLEIDEKEAAVRIELSGLAPDWSALFEKRTISSGCGSGITFTNYRMGHERRIDVNGPLMSLEDIRRLLRTFRNISTLYLETGGVHSAALSDGKEILFSPRISAGTIRGQAHREGIFEWGFRGKQDPAHERQGHLGDHDQSGQEPLPRSDQPRCSVVHGGELRRGHGDHPRRLCPRRPDEHLYLAEPHHPGIKRGEFVPS